MAGAFLPSRTSPRLRGLALGAVALRLGLAVGLLALALYLLYRFGAVVVPLLILLQAARQWGARTGAAVRA